MQPGEARPGRFPPSSEVLSAFHFVIFAICSWSIRGFLFRLSSLMLYLDLADLLSVLGYMMAFALIESLVVIGLLTAVSALLPASWLRTGFSYKAGLAVLVAGLASIALQNDLTYYLPALLPLVAGALAAFLLWRALTVWLHKSPGPQKVIAGIIERFAIFSYIYIPLGLIGAVIVLIRNLV